MLDVTNVFTTIEKRRKLQDSERRFGTFDQLVSLGLLISTCLTIADLRAV